MTLSCATPEHLDLRRSLATTYGAARRRPPPAATHGRAPDTFSRTQLLATLTLPQRYNWDTLMTRKQIALWLGKPQTTVARWLWRDQFPKPAGRVSSAGIRGGRLDAKRKGLLGWRACDVLRWLEATGRLVA